ncbi:hypothetical protein F5882DRAFT_468502 [Hyaloscypha sp. PMI_1271]|nr:hypothetical protein F5882DRAFT_468502 [Hyaloscypha sp. PMI_1271]
MSSTHSSKAMDNRHINLNRIDLDLHRLTNIQLDTIRQSYPDNVAVGAEWARRQPVRPLYITPKSTENHLTDIQFETVRRGYPNHPTINAEWERRHPSPPAPTYYTPENEISAHRITAIETHASSSRNTDAFTDEMEWEPTQWKQTTPSVSLTAVSHICRCPPCNILKSRQRQETSHFRVRVRAIADHQSENEEELEEDSEIDFEGNHKAKGIKYPYILGPIADAVFESHYLPGPHLEGTIRGEPIGPFVGSNANGCTYSSPESTDSELEDPQLFPISPPQALTPFYILPRSSLQQLPAASLPEIRRSSPLRQERFNFEDSAEDGPVMNPFGITTRRNLPRGNEKTKEYSWFQELAAQNALFRDLPAFDTVVESDVQDEDAPENAMNYPVDLIVPSVPYMLDGEGDAGEECNVVKTKRELEDVRLAEENEWLEEGSSHATGEGGDADDDDSNFGLGEEGYVFVNGNGHSDTGGSWSRSRAWNGTARKGSRRPSLVNEESESPTLVDGESDGQ